MLSDKKKAFAKAILQGLSNRDAAIKAGYSEKSASAAGSRLAKDDAVLNYISRLENVKEKVKEDITDFVPVGTTQEVKKVFKKGEIKPDSLSFLLQVMDDDLEDIGTRIECAKAVLPYQHSKKGDVGVKQSREDEAKELSSNSIFATRRNTAIN